MTTEIRPLMRAGTLAGLAAALLGIGASGFGMLASILYAASALPILVAGLAYGNRCAIIGIATALIFVSLMASPLFAAAMAGFTLAPAAWLAHLAQLARPASELGGPEDRLAWFPLSDILLHLCGLVSLVVVGFGVAIGYGPELSGALVDAMAQSMQTAQSGLPQNSELNEQVLAQTREMVLMMLPFVQAGIWVALLFAALYFALALVARMGKTRRPREDMPSSLRMSRNAVFPFLAGLVLCFVGGNPALIGAVIAGAFGAGFLMSGFAVLHLRSRGKDWRVPALTLCYLSAVFLLPAFVILIIGLVDTRRSIALTPLPKGPENNDSNDF